MNNAYANKKCTNNIYINNRYEIEVTRKRIKNMYLRVKDTDGTLSVSAPYGMSDTEIRKFVESKSDWMIMDAPYALHEPHRTVTCVC